MAANCGERAKKTIRGHALFMKPYIYPVNNVDGSIMRTGDSGAPSSAVQPDSWLNRNEGSGLSARVPPHANAHSQTNARMEPNRDTANAMTTLAPDKYMCQALLVMAPRDRLTCVCVRVCVPSEARSC